MCDDNKSITDEVYKLLKDIEQKSKNEFDIDIKNRGDFIFQVANYMILPLLI